MTHWHVNRETHHATQAEGEVGECCEGFATYDDVFGTQDSYRPRNLAEELRRAAEENRARPESTKRGMPTLRRKS